MSNITSSGILSQPLLPPWFDSEPGRALIEQQFDSLNTLVPDQFYRVGMQFGLSSVPMLDDLNVEQALYCDLAFPDTGTAYKAGSRVIAEPVALPLADSSVDLAVLLHTLDYCPHPHGVVREISQLLSPEGVLVISGFHPYSLWGLKRYLHKKQAPYTARFISRGVVQDWLALLGFQPLTGRMLNYHFPDLGKPWRSRLEWMNTVGDRWWPTMGSVYMLVLQKKIYSGVGLRHSARHNNHWFPELNPARARVAQNSRFEKQA